MELSYCLGVGSLSETKEPASVVCQQLMMILHCDFRRGVILGIKLFVNLVRCFPTYGISDCKFLSKMVVRLFALKMFQRV